MTARAAVAPQRDHRLEVPAGDYVFREGDLGTEMFIVHEGQIEISKRIGGEDKQLAVLEKGDFFGEMSLLEELPRAASARAVTDAKLVEINGSTFDRMLRNNPEIAVRMMRKLSRRLRQTDELLQQTLGTTETEASAGIPLPDRQRPLGEEVLVHEKSGMELRLSASSETTLGRKDPVTGIYPDVDLTPLDHQRSISRRHAKIYRRGDRFFLCEDIGTMNGTFVNGERLETGVPAEVRNGDRVRCGVVELVLRVGG
ncbi:MAG TPA: cyclic nucleotide-binding domain-containing protein [Thermoanaerobaculia bacterium]|nr:cyclic nucleotide-binding domain-containing protein [Thermoanaerobaculia bacterium]